MKSTKFGKYGGQYVPEVLMPAISELTSAYENYVRKNQDGFMDVIDIVQLVGLILEN